jgi:hypothetical protein
MTRGIYTLANDVVYDQLIALLNSIEVNVGTDIPVAVIAYDDNVSRVQDALKTYENVTLLNDPQLFEPWETFSYDAWATHPTALAQWSAQGIKGVNRIGMNRRYAAFDMAAPFDEFIYLDADTLVLSSLSTVFEAIASHPLVVYDFQIKDPSHIFNVESDRLHTIFPEERIRQEIFCAGFYGGQKGAFSAQERQWMVEKLAAGEADVLYMSAPNQSLLNYMVMSCQLPVYNLALTLPPTSRTGNSVTSPHFEHRDRYLYDKDVPLTYLHYIGVGSKVFRKLCEGENLAFPYRDIFLQYRYWRNPEAQPEYLGTPQPLNRPPNRIERFFKKVGL